MAIFFHPMCFFDGKNRLFENILYKKQTGKCAVLENISIFAERIIIRNKQHCNGQLNVCERGFRMFGCRRMCFYHYNIVLLSHEYNVTISGR